MTHNVNLCSQPSEILHHISPALISSISLALSSIMGKRVSDKIDVSLGEGLIPTTAFYKIPFLKWIFQLKKGPVEISYI